MATATKTETVNEPQIKQAVHTWAKAESSAIWALIRAIHKGLIGYEDNKKARLSALKTWVNQAAEEAWGQGAAKDRAAHISKIFTIAENATPAHFAKWEKAGTGFYKAYSEFAVPQRAKVAATTTTPAKTAEPAKGPDTVQVPTEQLRQEAKAAVDPAIAATIPKTQEPVQGFTVVPAEPGQPLPAPVPEEPVDYTAGWSARIDADPKMWTKLLDNLTDKRHPILTPGMVLDVMSAAYKRHIVFKNAISLLLQTDFVRDEVVEFISQNPTLFDGITVEPPKVKPKAKEEPKAEPAKA